MLGTSEFAKAVGAAPRQVIHWTENHILRALPGTDRKGTGNRRRYGEDEIPYGRLARSLSQVGMDVGLLQIALLRCRRDRLAFGEVERWLAVAPRWLMTDR